MNIALRLGLAFALVMSAAVCRAQNTETAPIKYFRLDFVVQEVDGSRILSSRTYSTAASTDPRAQPTIRTGSKLPLGLSKGETSYIDVGVSIDCRNLVEQGPDLSMVVTADVSSIATPNEESPNPTSNPVIRMNKWNTAVLLPLRKPTLVFSSDDLGSKHKMQMEITATPLR